jgi:PadR family transcriptional regulator, regulatory protein PadR
MDKITADRDSIRYHIDTIILHLLSEQDRYGYEIYKEVLDRTQGAYELKDPSLYSAIRRPEEAELIISYWGDESQGGRRKYYHLTKEGKISYLKSIEEWEKRKLIMDMILKLSH